MKTKNSMKFHNPTKAVVLLADGTLFNGIAVGNTSKTVTGEICFTTAMSGYEDFFLDPSYAGKIVVSAAAHIGGYGIKKDEILSEKAKISGLISRNFGVFYSREGADGSLQEFLEENDVMIISDVDTRALTAHIRDNGSMPAILSTEVNDIENLKNKLKEFKLPNTEELLDSNTIKETYNMGEEDAAYRIAAIDFGMKKNLLHPLVKRGCFIKVFPHHVPFSELQDFNPDGYFISGGPGNPMEMNKSLPLIQEILKTEKPLFATGIGHNLLALAKGVKSEKMDVGHHGLNHSTKNLLSGIAEITAQNHAYRVNKKELESHPELELTHIDLNDSSVEGIRLKNGKAFSVQYYPSSHKGATDSESLWNNFIENLKK